MKYKLFLTGALVAGCGAVYFLDHKEGKQRRKKFEKETRKLWKQTKEDLRDYSRELQPRVKEWSQEFSSQAQTVAERSVAEAKELKLNGNGWSPSARLLGATASAVAFYGAGRPGITGTILRTVSLGMFTKALLASK